MPVHDWTRVEDGIFHDFHVGWIPQLRTVLNAGLLPDGYYALAEQHAGRSIADVLTLHASPAAATPSPLPLPPDSGGAAVAEAPPRTRHKRTVQPAALARRRSLAIRHVSGHRLVALLEIVSPANKDRAQHNVEEFIARVISALDLGIHVLVVDLFPAGTNDPHGIHELILQRLEHGNNQPIVVWDAVTGQERHRLRGHGREVPTVAYSPKDANLLASGSYDKTVRLWNTATCSGT